METIKKPRKRKRGNYSHYIPEPKRGSVIIKMALSPAKRYIKELQLYVSKSTVRAIKTVSQGIS